MIINPQGISAIICLILILVNARNNHCTNKKDHTIISADNVFHRGGRCPGNKKVI